MCVHYLGVKDPQQLALAFEVETGDLFAGVGSTRDGLAGEEGVGQEEQLLPPPATTLSSDIWPAQPSVFIRRPKDPSLGEREAVLGRFGLIPHWAKDDSFGKRTYNARSETVAEKPSYRDAWRLGRRCIIPAMAFYEPDWRTGRAVSTRIGRADGKPMGIAGIWTGWKAPSGEIIRSFSMLTVNADEHPLMNRFHRPEDEKRMVVILREEQYSPWLAETPAEAFEMLGQYPADAMCAEPVG